MIIKENVSYSVGNVISFRGKTSPAETQKMLAGMEEYIDENDAKKYGPMITVAYSIEEDVTASDVGIYIPLDKEIPSSRDFTFLSVFKITDCVMVKYKGYPHLVLYAGIELLEGSTELGYKLKLPLYNVYINEPLDPDDMDKFEINIYAEKESDCCQGGGLCCQGGGTPPPLPIF